MSEELLKACQKGNLNQVKELLTNKNNSIDINHKSIFGDSPLIHAAWSGHLNIVEYLLTSDELTEHANIHEKNNNSCNALMYACINQRLDMVQYFLASDELKEHANIHEKNNSGENPLIYACYQDHIEVAEYLIIEQNMIIDNDTMNWLIKQDKQKILDTIQARDLHYKMNLDLSEKNGTVKQRKI